MAGHIFYLNKFLVISWFFFFKDQVLKKTSLESETKIINSTKEIQKRERERLTLKYYLGFLLLKMTFVGKNERIAPCFKLLLKK